MFFPFKLSGKLFKMNAENEIFKNQVFKAQSKESELCLLLSRKSVKSHKRVDIVKKNANPQKMGIATI